MNGSFSRFYYTGKNVDGSFINKIKQFRELAFYVIFYK